MNMNKAIAKHSLHRYANASSRARQAYWSRVYVYTVHHEVARLTPSLAAIKLVANIGAKK